jgi:hypothetical protein
LPGVTPSANRVRWPLRAGWPKRRRRIRFQRTTLDDVLHRQSDQQSQDQTHVGMVEWHATASQTRLGAGDTPTAGWAIFNVGTGIRLTQGGMVHNISLHLDNVFNRLYRDNLSVIKDFVPQPGRGVRLNYELLY